MPRAFTDSERDLIRSRLIAGGRRLLNKAGVRGVTVDDAAREAGISKGSFYSFFPSREDFILSVFESWEEEYRAALLASVSAGKGPKRKRLEDFFAGIFTLVEREPGLAYFGARELSRLVERLPPERLRAHQARDRRALDGSLREWADAGIIGLGDIPALRGAVSAIFLVAIHREDFGDGTYAPAARLISEALAARIAAGGGRDGKDRTRVGHQD